MYELRTPTIDGQPAGVLSRHDRLEAAWAANLEEELLLVRQLRANGEGCHHTVLDLDIVEVSPDGREKLLLSSRFRPGPGTP